MPPSLKKKKRNMKFWVNFSLAVGAAAGSDKNMCSVHPDAISVALCVNFPARKQSDATPLLTVV